MTSDPNSVGAQVRRIGLSLALDALSRGQQREAWRLIAETVAVRDDGLPPLPASVQASHRRMAATRRLNGLLQGRFEARAVTPANESYFATYDDSWLREAMAQQEALLGEIVDAVHDQQERREYTSRRRNDWSQQDPPPPVTKPDRKEVSDIS